MNALVRFYAESLKARELYSMGFKLSKWDEKLLKYGVLFEEKLMDLEVNIPLFEALDLGWEILALCFEKEEVGIKQDLIERYWKK
jgi:V/A-type H+-transporting ATPase subunit B